MAYKRLRQICLVAGDLEPPARQLVETFGLAEAHREPQIGHLGLCNVIIPVGATPIFIEIVSPIRPDTAAGRYLARRGGDGGYMFISDCNDLETRREQAQGLGMRVITSRDWPDDPPTSSFQLHPQDTGGAILEFDRHGSGDDMFGAYRWAGGTDWTGAIRAAPVRAVLGVEVQCERPLALAHRWAALHGVGQVRNGAAAPEFMLDNAFARFVEPTDGRGEGISAIHLAVSDPTAIRSSAREAGADMAGDDPVICGVRFVLNP